LSEAESEEGMEEQDVRNQEWNRHAWDAGNGRDQEWKNPEDIAEKIRNVVTDALDSMEFDQLNQAISDTVNSALNEAKFQFDKYKEKMGNWQKSAVQKPKPLEIRVIWRGKVSGILFTIFGGIGSVIFGFLTLVILAALVFSGTFSSGWGILGTYGILAAGFGGMLFAGIRNNGRIGRLKRYIKELKRNGKTYCDLEFLSRTCARTISYIRKDLRKMIGLGMLPDARLDDQGTCLILDDETYRQYQMAQESLKERQKEEQKRIEQEKTDPQQDALQTAIARGESYMETLDRLRESISCQNVTEKLNRLDAVLERLFDTLRKHPDQLDEMERFMEYYLPTTVKLVTAYQEFAAVEFPGENVNRAKKEIEETLDTINGAFEKLLDDLYQDAAFDAMTDATVLQSMLAREGLTESDFS